MLYPLSNISDIHKNQIKNIHNQHTIIEQSFVINGLNVDSPFTWTSHYKDRGTSNKINALCGTLRNKNNTLLRLAFLTLPHKWSDRNFVQINDITQADVIISIITIVFITNIFLFCHVTIKGPPESPSQVPTLFAPLVHKWLASNFKSKLLWQTALVIMLRLTWCKVVEGGNEAWAKKNLGT